MPDGLDWHRPKVLYGKTIHIDTACGEMAITLNTKPGTDEIIEVFVKVDNPGTCGYANTEMLGRMITWGLRYGASMKELVQQLSNIQCNRPMFSSGVRVASCADAVAKAIFLEV